MTTNTLRDRKSQRTTRANPYQYDTVLRMKRPVIDLLVAVASDRHGYVTTLDAREIGVDPTQLRLLAARGRLEHVAHGVYRVPVLPRTRFDDLARAVAWSRGKGVISHESALVLHGLSDVNPSEISLTVDPTSPPRSKQVEPMRLHQRPLATDEVTEVEGLPVTTIERTIRDCHRIGTDPAQLRLAITQAHNAGGLTDAEANDLTQLINGGNQ